MLYACVVVGAHVGNSMPTGAPTQIDPFQAVPAPSHDVLSFSHENSRNLRGPGDCGRDLYVNDGQQTASGDHEAGMLEVG